MVQQILDLILCGFGNGPLFVKPLFGVLFGVCWQAAGGKSELSNQVLFYSYQLWHMLFEPWDGTYSRKGFKPFRMIDFPECLFDACFVFQAELSLSCNKSCMVLYWY